MVDITISLTGTNGDTIDLIETGHYVLETGVSGFGIPNTLLRIEESAGAGGLFRFSKRGVRTIDLPIVIFGDTRDEVESNLRRLARLLQNTAGAITVQANYSDGTHLSLETYYASGAETQFGENANNHFCRWVITLKAPIPFWQSDVNSSFTIGTGGTGRSLLPQLTKLKVASSQSLGTITVTNNGDVETYPKWIVHGPLTNFSVSNGTDSFAFTTTIGATEVITIDTATGKVTDATGANRYSMLGLAPKLFPLQPGTSTLTVSGDSGTTATTITCLYAPRYEVIH